MQDTGSHLFEALENYKCHFEFNPAFDPQPMEFTEDGGDVVIFVLSHHKPGSCIDDGLQAAS